VAGARCKRRRSDPSPRSQRAASTATDHHDVEQISIGRVRLRAGTLYTALDRLRSDGLIEVDREEIVESRLRRYYRLTPTGAERLAEEAKRMRSNAHVAMSDWM